MAKHTKRFPTQHLVGFIFSIVLTLLAVWASFGTELSTTWIIVIIMVMAVIQAIVQLFMFMHITESASNNGHVPWNMIFHGFVLATIVVAGSLFVMYSGHGTAHPHNSNGEQHEMNGEHEMQGQHDMNEQHKMHE